MKSPVRLPIPAMKALCKFGQDISDARRRRRVTIKLMAERANVSRVTISKIEKGDSTTSIGAYASVLFVLGMVDRLNDLIDVVHDLTGQRLDEEKLPQRVRLPRSPRRENSHE